MAELNNEPIERRQIFRLLSTSFVIALCLIGCTYGPFAVADHFSLDSYSQYAGIDADIHLRNGRPISWALTSLLNYFGWNSLHNQTISTVILIVALSFYTACLSLIFLRHWKPKPTIRELVLVTLASSASFISVFFWEWFVFVESYPTCIFNLALVIAAIYFLFKGKGAILSFFLMTCAMSGYQIYIPMFIIWCGSLIFLRNWGKDESHYLRDSGITITVSALSALSGILIMKAMTLLGITTISRESIGGFQGIADNIVAVIKVQGEVWVYGSNLMPKYSHIVLLCFAIIIIWYELQRNRWKDAGLIVIALVALYAVAYLPHYFTAVSWIVPRTLTSISCFWTLLWIMAIRMCPDSSNRMQALPTVGIVMLLAINMWSIWGAIHAQYHVNDLNAEYAHEVERAINEYESSSGQTIATILFTNDPNPTHKKPGMTHAIGDTNVLAAPVSWALIPMINLYNDEDYTGYSLTGEKAYLVFGDKYLLDYDCFDKDNQMVFEGSTAYLIVY